MNVVSKKHPERLREWAQKTLWKRVRQSEAMKKGTGARALRSLLERLMLDVMYDVPSEKGIKECLVNEDVVEKREKPVLIYEKQSA
jgi:ATP-dependent Clp protease ATP-binding subunit ClpX